MKLGTRRACPEELEGGLFPSASHPVERLKMIELKTRPLCRYQAQFAPGQHDIGKGHFGRRAITLVTGGAFEGERLMGDVLDGGGDWATIDTERDLLRIDARLTWQTHDGAKIYVYYNGVIRPVSKLRDHAKGRPVTDLYFRTTPIFETGDPRYQWLTDLVTVGCGRLIDGGVEYDVFEVL